jgi:hypothetical protein
MTAAFNSEVCADVGEDHRRNSGSDGGNQISIPQSVDMRCIALFIHETAIRNSVSLLKNI